MSEKRTSWRVYAVDKVADWAITVGGLTVILAVLGILLFIALQVFPLFVEPKSGPVTTPATAGEKNLSGKSVFICCDEYRRIAVNVDETGRLDVVNLATGEVFDGGALDIGDGARITAAFRSTRVQRMVTFEGTPNVPEYDIALGTSDGRILPGVLRFQASHLTFQPGEEIPDNLQRLRRPGRDDFSAPEYVPETLIEEHDGRKVLIEPLEGYGSFRVSRAALTLERAIKPPSEGAAIIALDHARGGSGGDIVSVTVAATDTGRVLVVTERYDFNPMTEETELVESREEDLSPHIKGKARFVVVNEACDRIVAATPEGDVTVFGKGPEEGWIPDKARLASPTFSVFADHDDRSWSAFVAGERRDTGLAPASESLRLTAMASILGDTSLLFADSHGGLQSWFSVRIKVPAERPPLFYLPAEPGAKPIKVEAWREDRVMQRIHTFEPAASFVEDFSIAQKGKAFLTAERDGALRLFNMTSERRYFSARASGDGAPRAYFPIKGNGVVAVGADGAVGHWWLDAPHGGTAMSTFFGKIHYEGYDKPEYIWQSSAGTDDVEYKFSLVPLLVGTLKGALYAMLFSVPIAVLAAVYTSEFMSLRLRNVIKPVMEIMASLPSVVLGFLAALYMAPLAAPNMTSVVLFFALLPALCFLFGWLWQQIPPSFAARMSTTWRSLLILLLIFSGSLFASVTLGPTVERFLFPRAESADAFLLSPKNFTPVNEAMRRRLDTGDFRNWTSGGKALIDPLVQVIEEGPDAAPFREDPWAAAAPQRFGPKEVAAHTAPSLKEGTRTTIPKQGADGAKTESTQTLLGLFPAGWWLPGGHNLFRFILVILLTPLVVFGFRATFTGVDIFRWRAHLWQARPGDRHPLTLVAGVRARFTGTKDGGFTPVLVDVLLAAGFSALVMAVAIGLALVIGPVIESLLFSFDHPTAGSVADFRRALLGGEGVKFEQTNSLVVGFAMGFAVIPIIYTISEDALTSVPNQLRAASLACGASPWQTAARVSLPAALPGIFSAMVIGLGRAIGETMIVVMAAGGTPVTEWEPLSGFRSLSAAIAIEMPEAPHGGTLFRTLFLAGLLLFVMTFAFNTVAEVVRIRLRRKLARV